MPTAATTMRAWVLERYGEPNDVLALEDVPVPEPGPHQVLVDVEAVGVGFPDLLRVRGEYQIAQPLGTAPGSECVGRVRRSGSETAIEPGTRIMGCSDIG